MTSQRLRSSVRTLLVMVIPFITLVGCGRAATQSTNVTIAPNVYVVEGLTAQQATVATDSLSFPLSGNEALLQRKPGDVLVSGKGDGFMRRVISVAQSGGTVAIATEQAALNEVILKGIIQGGSAQPLPDSRDNLGTDAQALSVDLSATGFHRGGLELAIKSGHFSYNPEVHFGDWEFDLTGPKAFDLSLDGPAAVDLSYQLSVAATSSDGSEQDVGAPIVKRYYLQAGLVPIVVKVTIRVVIGYASRVDGSVSMTHHIAGSGPVGLGLHYENGAWTTPGSNDLKYVSDPPSFEAEATLAARIYLRSIVNIDLNGVFGPTLQTTEWLQADGTLRRADCDSSLQYAIAAGIDSDLTARLHFLSKTLADFGPVSVYSTKFVLLEGTFNPLDGGTACDGGAPDAGLGPDAGTQDADAGNEAPDGGADSGTSLDGGTDAGLDGGASPDAGAADGGACGDPGQACCAAGEPCHQAGTDTVGSCDHGICSVQCASTLSGQTLRTCPGIDRPFCAVRCPVVSGTGAIVPIGAEDLDGGVTSCGIHSEPCGFVCTKGTSAGSINANCMAPGMACCTYADPGTGGHWWWPCAATDGHGNGLIGCQLTYDACIYAGGATAPESGANAQTSAGFCPQ